LIDTSFIERKNKMNKTLFKTENKTSKKLANTVLNAAGGKAYELSAEQALSQYAVTNCFSTTFYASAEEHLGKVKELLGKVRPELIAKIAVYSAKEGNMKDMPTFLVSYLFSIGEVALVRKIFNKVVYNAKMLCNFVQLVRSGTHGRKSFGTVGKELIQNWLTARTAEQLFKDSVGHSNPSLVDIIKMVHPKFLDNQNNMVKYLMGKPFDFEILPDLVQRFEKLKKGEDCSPEGLDFRLLSNLKLSTAQWSKLAVGMTWNALRMNLNNLSKHGVFNTDATPKLAEKLSDEVAVKKFNAFPYQLLTTYKNVGTAPDLIKKAIEKALEAATSNVPNLGNVAVCIDVSGSMSSPATGYSAATTSTTCVDVAALVASCILRTAEAATIVPFDTAVRKVAVNKYDTVLTNSKKLAINGGGTACGSAMKHLFDTDWSGNLVFFVSDNMSWADYHHRGTVMAEYWKKIKAKNKDCKLVLLDVVPNTTSQMWEDKDVLHIAGFSDAIYGVVDAFLKNNDNFVDVIEKVEL